MSERVEISVTGRWSDRVFREVYSRYINRLRAYVLRRVRNHADADEIAAETLARAAVHLDQREPDSPELAAWLFAAARNLTLNHRRSSKRVVTISIEDIADQAPAEEVSPDKGLIDEEDFDRLAAAIRRLPEDRRQALLLRFLHELPHSEIAEVLGKSEGSARVLLHRTVEQLRREVG